MGKWVFSKRRRRCFPNRQLTKKESGGALLSSHTEQQARGDGEGVNEGKRSLDKGCAGPNRETPKKKRQITPSHFPG